LAGLLAGYRGLGGRRARWTCVSSRPGARSLPLCAVRHADVETFFARDLEERGRAYATVTRRLCTIAGFYRYAVEE